MTRNQFTAYGIKEHAAYCIRWNEQFAYSSIYADVCSRNCTVNSSQPASQGRPLCIVQDTIMWAAICQFQEWSNNNNNI